MTIYLYLWKPPYFKLNYFTNWTSSKRYWINLSGILLGLKLPRKHMNAYYRRRANINLKLGENLVFVGIWRNTGLVGLDDQPCIQVFEDKGCVFVLRHVIAIRSLKTIGVIIFPTLPAECILWDLSCEAVLCVCIGLHTNVPGNISHSGIFRLICFDSASWYVWHNIGLPHPTPAQKSVSAFYLLVCFFGGLTNQTLFKARSVHHLCPAATANSSNCSLYKWAVTAVCLRTVTPWNEAVFRKFKRKNAV